jgi:hypothetical protein
VSISSLSFWQQDRNWFNQQASRDQQLTGANAVNNAMTSALTNKSSGLASISNQIALTRVTKQLADAATAALKSGGSGNSTTSNASGPAILSASGILPSSASNLQSASTAQSMLASVLSSESSIGSLAGLLSGTSLNVVA